MSPSGIGTIIDASWLLSQQGVSSLGMQLPFPTRLRWGKHNSDLIFKVLLHIAGEVTMYRVAIVCQMHFHGLSYVILADNGRWSNSSTLSSVNGRTSFGEGLPGFQTTNPFSRSVLPGKGVEGWVQL